MRGRGRRITCAAVLLLVVCGPRHGGLAWELGGTSDWRTTGSASGGALGLRPPWVGGFSLRPWSTNQASPSQQELESTRGPMSKLFQSPSSAAGGFFRRYFPTATAWTRPRATAHAGCLGGVWLYVRGSSSAQRRCTALAALITTQSSTSSSAVVPAVTRHTQGGLNASSSKYLAAVARCGGGKTDSLHESSDDDRSYAKSLLAKAAPLATDSDDTSVPAAANLLPPTKGPARIDDDAGGPPGPLRSLSTSRNLVASSLAHARGLVASLCATNKKSYNTEEEQQHKRRLRVLCLDGGGMKGLNLLLMIRELEKRAGKPASELFDVVCGSSIGGCGALFVAHFGAEACDRAEVAFDGLRTRCFASSSATRFLLLGQRCADERSALVSELLGGADVMLTSAGTTSSRTRNHRRGSKRRRVPFAFVVAANRDPSTGDPEPFLFRTYRAATSSSETTTTTKLPPLPGTSNASLVDAIVATTAAPTYFPVFTRRGAKDARPLHDGGCAFNNPTLVALHELAAVFPDRKLDCLVSLGCGRNHPTTTHGATKPSKKSSDDARGVPAETVAHRHAKAVATSVHRGCLYDRLDPPLPNVISPGEHREDILRDMEAHTRRWLATPDVSARLDAIARRLADDASLSPSSSSSSSSRHRHRLVSDDLSSSPSPVAA